MARRKQAVILAVFFIVLTAASATFFGWITKPASGEDLILPTDGKLHVLLIGEDDGLVAPGKKVRGRSDTLMVASYDPKTGNISLLSIPRDTRVAIPGREHKEKINHAYAYGGPELTLRTVRQFLGMPIRYYALVNTSGFRELVDAIGGVPIDVEKPMKYTDKAGGLYINLEPGPQVLNGEQAEGYVRYRKSASDLARAARQQKFMAAALKQLLQPKNLLKINQLFKIARNSLETNIPIGVALRYLPLVKSLQADKITSYTLEGEDAWINGTYYFEPDLDKLEELIDTYFYSALDVEANQQTKVKVYAGNGDLSSAEQVARLLRKSGFQVTGVFATENSDLLVSQVICTNKESQGALVVAEILSIQEILLDTQAGADVDVVVIVGKDMLP